jgi:hypothetical protein
MKKPEFPKPRLIREDFLPEQDPMKNYRIKKVIDGHSTRYCRYYPQTRYYPQEKLFGLWMNMFGFDRWYSTLQNAQDAICEHLRKRVVEYLEVNCEETK